MTPEQMIYIKSIDLVTTWHLLHENLENAAFYVNSLMKSNTPEDFKQNYWFATPGLPRDPQDHTPIQKLILKELQNLEELVKLNIQDDRESRKQTLTNFDWTNSMLQPEDISQIEDLLVEFHDVFARHRST